MNRQKTQQNSLRQQSIGRRSLPFLDSRRLPPLFTRMGPVALSICSVLLISFMAILYLSQLGQAVTTNQQIQALRSQQAQLQRQNHDLLNTAAQEQSPAYIASHASSMGLQPANPENVQVVELPGVKGQESGSPTNQP